MTLSNEFKQNIYNQKNFNHNRYTTSDQISNALGNLRRRRIARSQRFNLVNTLQLVRQNMFTAQNGDRPNVGNGLIIITDTTSTDNRVNINEEIARMGQVRFSKIRTFKV